VPRSYRLFAILALWPVAAFAYIDPGSGMLLWQGAIAAIGAIVVFVRHPIRTVKNLLSSLRKRNDP
jgi:hypothetical protein